ncbi:hypothetical protein PVAND_007903 [Polypedilum vanderplanki]|uniref:Uncharacterized protein n=1 Tax=Polypedilum vanderplanki TaxID=319348 RepID=A0A9J6C8V0_POLVA|nr:hypothetical protein PVAND_007903 [Polypedilum vanderplanki]
MQNYLKISFALSAFGFLKETRLIEPFLTDYYTSYDGVTEEVINREIFPVGTYSHMIQLLIIFLITDYLRYKPLIIVLGLSSVSIWGIMLLVKAKLGLQIIEVIYGTFCACEVAYYSYIYAKTDKQHYQIVTSHTRAAVLLGKFFSATLSQLIVYFFHDADNINYRQLNFITFIFQVVTAIWSIFFIPSVNRSIYFHCKEIENVESTKQSFSSAFMLIWEHFKTSYRNETVLLWCIFYAFSFCLYFQITAYIQILWLAIDEYVFWNATVDGCLTLLSAIAMLIAGKIQISFLKKQSTTMIVLILMSLLQGVFMFFAATALTLLTCYIFYILNGIAYGFSITICATKIAENIAEDSHGLVFGFNTFIALCIQTCLTLAIVSSGFKLPAVGQFIVYSVMYFILGFFFLVKFLIDWCRSR